MSVDLSTLVPGFKAKVDAALAKLAQEGLQFQPYVGIRDPVTQAKLWRQSRSSDIVQKKIDELKSLHCDFLVECFNRAGAQQGKRVTGALPGESWHQYGEAVDCYLVDASGKPSWDSPKYSRFGEVGVIHGLKWGGDFADNDHWQFRQTEPGDAFGSIKAINDEMEQRWAKELGIPVAPGPISTMAAAAAPRLLSAFKTTMEVAADFPVREFQLTSAPAYKPSADLLPLLGNFPTRIPPANPNTQAFVHPPRYLGPVPTPAMNVLLFDSALELDTDGFMGDVGDPDFQSGTSLRYKDKRQSLNANTVPYFVLPLPTSWPAFYNIGLGDYAAVLFNGKVAFGVFGDFGPHNKIGEGSLELLRRIGCERVKPNGTIIDSGTEPGVVTIVFPGSGDAADRTDEATLLAAINKKGNELLASIRS